MLCPNCGEKCEVNSKFCTGCGNDFSKNPMVEEELGTNFSSGVKVWILLCIVIQSINVIGLLGVNAYVMLAAGLASVISNILLLIYRKKIYFFFIVASVVAIFMANVFIYDVSVYRAIFGFLNPIVTFGAISKYWKNM